MSEHVTYIIGPMENLTFEAVEEFNGRIVKTFPSKTWIEAENQAQGWARVYGAEYKDYVPPTWRF